MSKVAVSKVSPSAVFSKEVNDYYVAKYRAKELTMPEIKKHAYAQLQLVYNTLFTNLKRHYHNNGWAELKVGMVVERELFENYVYQLSLENVNAYSCFNYLKRNDVIGVCGAGYIFEEEQL